MNLVTEQEAMDFLRYDERPAGLDLLIEQVSRGILNYLGEDAPFIPDQESTLKIACLIWLSEIDQNREGNQNSPIDWKFGYGFPPSAVVSFLAQHRCPRMA